MQFILSDQPESVKADAISSHWTRFCRSKAEVLDVFDAVDIVHILLHDRHHSKQIVPFVCYAIVRSKQIRRSVMSVLENDEKSRSLSDTVCVADQVLLLASLSIDIVADHEMLFLLNHILSLPREYILEQLVVLAKLSRSLPFVRHDHAIRVRCFLNRVVSAYIIGDVTVDDRQNERFAQTVSSIAKSISQILPDSNCFPREIWAPFLHEFLLDHDIVAICNYPVVVEDTATLPYRMKCRIRRPV